MQRRRTEWHCAMCGKRNWSEWCGCWKGRDEQDFVCPGEEPDCTTLATKMGSNLHALGHAAERAVRSNHERAQRGSCRCRVAVGPHRQGSCTGEARGEDTRGNAQAVHEQLQKYSHKAMQELEEQRLNVFQADRQNHAKVAEVAVTPMQTEELGQA